MLVGRESQQRLLAGLLEGARAGSGAALVFTGDPGIGKTALLDSAVTSANGFTVVRALGIESEADLPFAALGDLLRPLERHFAKLSPPQERMLRAAVALGDPMNGDRLGLSVATLGVLASAARRRPLLVVLDDLHWFDSESRVILGFVAARLGQSRVAVVAAARPGKAGALPAAFSPVVLPPLGDADAEQLVRGGTTTPVPSAVVERVIGLAAGNPLALIELPSILGDPAQPARGAALDEPVSVSASIERAFGAQIDGLPVLTRRALLLVSASGDAVTVKRAMASAALPAHALDAADDAGALVFEGRRVRFRHPLLASIVYQRASAPARRAAHAALAEVETDDDRRAWHLAGAATPPDDEAAAVLETTALRALRRGAAASGSRGLERAAELSSTRPDRGRRLALAARAAHRAGDMIGTSRLATAARDEVEDRLARADLLILESDVRMRGGDFEGAHATLAAEAEQLAQLDPRRAGTMLLLAAKLQVYRFEAAAGLTSVERALELQPTGERETAHLAALAMTRTMAGHPAAREAALAAAAAARETPHGHMHTLGIAWPLVWLEEYQAAREIIARAIAVQREHGVLAFLPQALLPLAELEFRTGRWAHASESAREALSLFQESGQPTEAAVAGATLARLAAAAGNEDTCRAYARDAIASDVDSSLRAATAFAQAALGHLALASGDQESATEALGDALSVLSAGGVLQPWLLPVHADLVEAHLHAGSPDRARDVADALERQAEASGSWSAQAAAARSRALLAGEREFESWFERALELHAGQPTPFERARTELCYGERLRRARRRRDARQHLRSAVGLFEALGAVTWADRARTELRASGERRRPEAVFSRALTTQELKVARLVVQGATNRETASALFVSPKTIEFHLGNVYRKLGVRSRTELVRALSADSGESGPVVQVTRP